MSDLNDLLTRKAAMLSGDSEKIALQKKQGKLTARERISALLDEGSLVEIDAFITQSSAGFGTDKPQVAGDGVLAGYGTIDGNPVVVFSQDFTVFGGSISSANAKKIAKVYDLAIKNGCPIISVTDSAGARIQEGAASMNGYGEILKHAASASGVIPQISIIAGPCIGGAAFYAALSDFVFAVDKISKMSVVAPQVLQAAENLKELDSIGSARELYKQGTAHFLCDNEESCFDLVKQLVSYLPSNNLEDVPSYEEGEPASDLSALTNYEGDMLAAIKAVVDFESLLEVQAGYASNIITALAQIKGATVGIIANNAAINEGRLDSAACAKGARFVRFCDCFSIPVVSLADSAGFVLSTNEEKYLAQSASKLIYAFAEATVPLVSVVMGKAIGAGYVAMCNSALGADMVYAFPQAQISPLNPDTAVAVLFSKELSAAQDPVAFRTAKEEEYALRFASPFEAANLGYVDDVIDPAALRQVLDAALNMLFNKRASTSPKKHGNMPL
ncbi:MAG: acyl-CoA carboxylase subunit beta [Christensenellales bacterium]